MKKLPANVHLRAAVAELGGSMTARGAGRGSEWTFSDRFGCVRIINVPGRQINASDRAFYQLPEGAENWEDCPLG